MHRHLLCLDDFEPAAKRVLPAPLFGYIAGSTETGHSFLQNRQSFQRYAFLPRVLRDVGPRSTATTLFGQEYAAPFGIAPMGVTGLFSYRGDLALTYAAAQHKVPFILSGSSLVRLEDVMQANPASWFQAYLAARDEPIRALLARVQAAGYRTLVVTVDTTVAANRENNVRSGFQVPLRPSLQLAWQGISHPRWLAATFLKTIARHGVPHFENNEAERGAPILSATVERGFFGRGHLAWEHLDLVRKLWPHTLVVKGVLHPQDARECVARGADGLIVSNHGGRQLDGAIAPLRVLPLVVDACPGVPVMLDGGVRRGSDVLKAVALGASFVFLGRPFAFALAVGGQAGASRVIELLQQEVSRDMALLGVNTLDAVGPECLEESGII